ncbi:hypothetical protein EVAR_27618_1 [Eumeta japonica]|uniref:Uncharacterized protein n=1 Tax=Eumeta variegata TaxID=151549 RepID=A0A4C1V0E6_EUMVA|nr:hypothetical protein EVAR_27618_1 [Eumeta japonica]
MRRLGSHLSVVFRSLSALVDVTVCIFLKMCLVGLKNNARASQKYGSRLPLERGGYELCISNPVSGVERVGRFQERHKVATERSVHDATPTSRALPLWYLSPFSAVRPDTAPPDFRSTTCLLLDIVQPLFRAVRNPALHAPRQKRVANLVTALNAPLTSGRNDFAFMTCTITPFSGRHNTMCPGHYH